MRRQVELVQVLMPAPRRWGCCLPSWAERAASVQQAAGSLTSSISCAHFRGNSTPQCNMNATKKKAKHIVACENTMRKRNNGQRILVDGLLCQCHVDCPLLALCPLSTCRLRSTHAVSSRRTFPSWPTPQRGRPWIRLRTPVLRHSSWQPRRRRGQVARC